VVHDYNPSYSEGEDLEHHSSRPARQKAKETPSEKKSWVLWQALVISAILEA
jgi:hypothetical protein